ncbi:hypothetical protein F5Y04DRAFT_142190 [Hypomontagnella monticulosa]|nr:hypothetical protein F5Y04DRAFT_142190 [Hypomontagnella monticulosa]
MSMMTGSDISISLLGCICCLSGWVGDGCVLTELTQTYPQRRVILEVVELHASNLLAIIVPIFSLLDIRPHSTRVDGVYNLENESY